MNLWELGSVSYTAAGDLAMPGESKRFLVMAGATAGDVKAQAEYNGSQSEIGLFVSPNEIQVSPGAINLGHPESPEPPAEVALTLIEDAAAGSSGAVFTGSAERGGMTVLGGESAQRFTPTLTSVSGDIRTMTLALAAAPGTEPSALVIATEVRCRYRGRQRKAQMIVDTEIAADWISVETSSDLWRPLIPKRVGLGAEHTTRAEVDARNKDLFVRTRLGAPPAASPTPSPGPSPTPAEERRPTVERRPSPEYISVAISNRTRNHVGTPEGEPFETPLPRLQRQPGTNIYGYLHWRGNNQGSVTFTFAPSGTGWKAIDLPTTVVMPSAVILPIDFVQLGDERSAMIVVDPQGSCVTLTLAREGGTDGDATFLDGTRTKVITETQHVFIRGAQASLPEATSNIILTASGGLGTALQELAREDFGVRDLSAAFAGVTFNMANATGASVADAARAKETTLVNKPAVSLEITKPVTYVPEITIAAPSDTKAREFEAGLVQNVLATKTEYTYATGVKVRMIAVTLPIKDGVPSNQPCYDEVFMASGPSYLLASFPGNNGTVRLQQADTPWAAAFRQLLDWAGCRNYRPPLENAALSRIAMRDEFRTWVVVRHKPTGAVRRLHHIDWQFNCEVRITAAGLEMTDKAIEVTVPGGDGSPPFVRGIPVIGDPGAGGPVCVPP